MLKNFANFDESDLRETGGIVLITLSSFEGEIHFEEQQFRCLGNVNSLELKNARQNKLQSKNKS
ncbi:hypothetical protein Ga0061065_12017 [Marinomonas fungiae]|uniref:Uncharacterized protein n=1 Tax=Marinomonas fungiae TaxID=1137284 RepID=A0A0K6ITK2_9GAMM|nr:hypothetical protein Ga0061065_12017 [Marinomonas fungiae]